MKWIKGLILAFFLLIGLPLLLVMLMSQSSSDSRRFEWGNGKVLNIEQLTHGSTHRFGPPPFLGGLKQVLPSFPILPSIQHGTAPDSLVLWLTLEDTEQDFMVPLTNVVRAIARDQHGSRFINTTIETRDERHWRTQPSWGGTQTPPPTSKWFISTVTLNQYPKGESTFEVDLLDHDENVLQTIEINNPQIISPSEWQGSPLPIEHTHEDLTIRLTQFTNTWAICHIGRDFGEIPEFKSHFKFLSATQATEQVVPYWLFDSGTAADTFQNVVSLSGHEAGNLSLHSKAWKITYDFYQHHDAPFPGDQVWELTIEMPEEGKSKSLDLEHKLLDVPVKLLNVAGPKTKATYKEGILQSAELAERSSGTSLSSSSSYSGGKFVHTVTYTSAEPYLGVHYPEDYHKYRILMLAKNGEGVFIPISSNSRSQHHHFIGIRKDQIASEIDLKVIIRPVFQKSFLVQPSITPPVHQFAKAEKIPERSKEAPSQTIDLSDYYTQRLDQSAHILGRLGTGSYGASFSYRYVEPGIHLINNQDWDLRGVVLMTGTCLYNFYLKFPEKIDAIPVKSKASKIHFLHGCLWPGDRDHTIGNYIVHYTNGATHTIPLVYDKNIANVWDDPGKLSISEIEQAKLVELPLKSSRNNSRPWYSYHYTWENPNPDLTIEHIAVQANRKESAPMILGITME